MEKLYTVDDVAIMTGLTSRTIRNYLADGRLKGRKIGSQWRFTEADINGIFSDPSAAADNSAPNQNADSSAVAAFLRPQPRTTVSICAVVDYPVDSADTIAPLVQKLTDQISLLASDNLSFTYEYDQVNRVARFTLVGALDMVAKLIKTIRKE